jgi:hypothetical protein
LNGILTQNDYGTNCRVQGGCNAKNENGVSMFVDQFGFETDCVAIDDDDFCDQHQSAWRNNLGVFYSTSDCIPRPPCTIRTTLSGNVDADYWGWDCVSLASDDFCNSKKDSRNIYTSRDGFDDCIKIKDCAVNPLFENSKYLTHIFARNKHASDDVFNFESWKTYSLIPSKSIGEKLTQACRIVKVDSREAVVDYNENLTSLFSDQVFRLFDD